MAVALDYLTVPSSRRSSPEEQGRLPRELMFPWGSDRLRRGQICKIVPGAVEEPEAGWGESRVR